MNQSSRAGAEPDPSEEVTTNSVDQATRAIREEILSGRYGPGERIKVGDLVSLTGLSPMPLREALRKLEGEGLVEIEPNRGAIARRLDRKFVEDLFEINTELRILALRRGLARMTFEKLSEFEALARAYDDAVGRGDGTASLRINREFHSMLVASGGNAEALRIFQRGWELISAFRRSFGYGAGRESSMAQEMRMLVEAMRRHDLQLGEAILRMQNASALEDMVSRLGQP